MSIVFLNGKFLPAEQAKISPMDRGFLFGDGIYEVIPAYNGHYIGLIPHINRMENGLNELQITTNKTSVDWQHIVQQLVAKNLHDMGDNLGVYLQVSRGTDVKRYHAYPENIVPTMFGFCFAIPPAPIADREQTKCYHVATTDDLRWQRCHIKSTALLGNVMHFQQGYSTGNDEILLFNRHKQLTEASSSNAFIVKDNVVITPPLDNQILPGITRYVLLDILKKHSNLLVEQRAVHKDEVLTADEVWLTSSTKEIAPVTQIDGTAVGDGKPGKVWQQAQQLFSQYKFEY